MPTALIKFKLPEEQCEYLIAVNSMGWALTCYDFDNDVRNLLKYGHTFKTADESMEWMRQHLRDLLADRNISLDMIE